MPQRYFFGKFAELVAVDDTDVLSLGHAENDIATFAATAIVGAADGAVILSSERNQL